MTLDTATENLIVTAYTPGGFRVTLAFPKHMSAVELDNWLLPNGYLDCAPGLEPGQQKEAITYVVRRDKHNDDGTKTPIIDFYIDKLKYKYAHLYLDNASDIAEFEAQSGLKLYSLKSYDGEVAMDREKAGQKFWQFAHKVARPFQMVRTPNGHYDNNMPRYEYGYFAPATPSAQNDSARHDARTGQTEPTKPPEQGSLMAQQVNIIEVNVDQTATGRPYIRAFLDGDAVDSVAIWSREVLTEQGYAEAENWCEVGKIYKPTLPIPVTVKYDANKGFWSVADVKPAKNGTDPKATG